MRVAAPANETSAALAARALNYRTKTTAYVATAWREPLELERKQDLQVGCSVGAARRAVLRDHGVFVTTVHPFDSALLAQRGGSSSQVRFEAA